MSERCFINKFRVFLGPHCGPSHGDTRGCPSTRVGSPGTLPPRSPALSTREQERRAGVEAGRGLAVAGRRWQAGSGGPEVAGRRWWAGSATCAFKARCHLAGARWLCSWAALCRMPAPSGPPPVHCCGWTLATALGHQTSPRHHAVADVAGGGPPPWFYNDRGTRLHPTLPRRRQVKAEGGGTDSELKGKRPQELERRRPAPFGVGVGG